MTGSFAIIRLNSLQESVEFIKAVNLAKFKNSFLRTQHYPGNLRSVGQQLYEELDIQEQQNKTNKIKENQNLMRKLLTRNADIDEEKD
jgi:hypothetical protein